MSRPDNMKAVRRALATIISAVVLATAAPAPAAASHHGEQPIDVEPFILGGVVSAPGAWPATVALVVDNGSELIQFCGGTLIRADLVLTAAHCTAEFGAGELQVLVGRSDLSVTGGELVGVSEVIQHPDWSAALWRSDISLVRLSRPAPTQPVPFTTPSSEPRWASSPAGTLLGWGATDPLGTVSSPQLKELAVSVLDDDQCSNRVRTFFAGTDLCVEAPTFGPCPGDSGGPLMVRVGGSARVAGVISRGPADPCGRGPSIVTRVAAYADWIYQTTLSATTTRIAGADRYSTAAALSARFESGVPVVYLVTGEAFPDAVTAAAVAGRAGGPVLLTMRDELPAVTRTELARLQPRRVVIVGGQSAISNRVAAQAAEWAGVAPTRLAGSDRYATAAFIAADAFPAGAPTVYLTVGTAFPDAVASGPVAGGAAGGPVLLTESAALPGPTREQLAALAPSRVVILGGSAAVTPAVEAAVASLLPDASVARIAGADRFATSAALSRATFAPGVPVLYVATGMAFPDALTSGPLAVRQGAPVLLIDGNRLPASVVEEIRRLEPARIEVLGGSGAVPLDAMWHLDGLY